MLSLCRQLQAGKSQRLIFTAIQEAWQQHINKEVDKTVPSVLQIPCWPSWAITKVQMEGRGWNILRKANSDSWKGRQAFHHGQGRWRIKWSNSRDARFHYGNPRHLRHSGEDVSYGTPAAQSPHFPSLLYKGMSLFTPGTSQYAEGKLSSTVYK